MPRQSKPTRVAFAVCLLCFIVAPQSRGEETLRWKFGPGQVFTYQLVQETTNQLSAGDAGIIQTSTVQTIDMTWTVEEVKDDGSARIKHDIKRVQMSMQAPMNQGFQLDTASPEPPEGLATMLAPAFNALVEHGYTVTMAPTGELSDVSAHEELVAAIKRLPGAGGAATGEDAIKALALPIAVPLPTDPVEAGADWSRTAGAVEVPMFGKMQVETSYTYKGPREAEGKSLAAIEPALTLNATGAEGGQMTGTVKTKSSSGEILFDRQAGRLEASTVLHTIDLSMTVGQNTISGTIDQTSKVKFGVATEPPAGAGDAAEPAAP
ncbi:MAG: DUF6263 family protein [Planctomycetota bacterium]